MMGTCFISQGIKITESHDTFSLQNITGPFSSILYLVHLFIFNVTANIKLEGWHANYSLVQEQKSQGFAIVAYLVGLQFLSFGSYVNVYLLEKKEK